MDRLKQLLELLRQQLCGLNSRIEHLENRLVEKETSALDEVQPMEIPSLPIPPLVRTDEAHVPTSQTQAPPPKPAIPVVAPVTPVPEPARTVPLVMAQTTVPEIALPPLIFPSSAGEPPSIKESVPPKFTAANLDETAKGSFEMRLGTYWLVRVGIVFLLTAMAFFARYAYQNYFGHLGPVGKLVLMYIGSGLLLGAGFVLQRKRRSEALQNYGQVLFAGGLALVYFTTYAAHHIPNLRVIANAVLDGALLLAWTAFIVWIADRKKSEVLALFAIGLAYYTSIITTIGLFTLYSNLLLTIAAVFFLLRNRWTRLSFTSLVATYVAMSRLHDNVHYMSDVVFGATTGIIIGRSVTFHGRNFYASPMLLPKGGGIIVNVHAAPSLSHPRH